MLRGKEKEHHLLGEVRGMGHQGAWQGQARVSGWRVSDSSAPSPHYMHIHSFVGRRSVRDCVTLYASLCGYEILCLPP